ncbi:MAG TPA: TfuA-like protein [Ktedonobacteraceae bacterium]|jgi:hypothetical protein|nr:TfuA-like protein [Ktedonobacteraceae bacterium]
MPYNQVTECRGSEGIFVGTSRGDIQELLAHPPRIIGIIDGVFAQNLSISTKEILQILEKDVTVLGASSMGALRAAELHAFGMKGIGKVFALYASGRVDADDEVALIHDEDGRQLSEPMVNIRFALQEVRVANMISLEEKRYLLRVAKMLYFPERTYRRIYTIARQHLPEETLHRLQVYLQERKSNVKRDDALLLLKEAKRLGNQVTPSLVTV